MQTFAHFHTVNVHLWTWTPEATLPGFWISIISRSEVSFLPDTERDFWESSGGFSYFNGMHCYFKEDIYLIDWNEGSLLYEKFKKWRETGGVSLSGKIKINWIKLN